MKSTDIDRYLALVKAGTSTAVQIRASKGSPQVAVKVVGYVPKTAPFVIPEAPASALSAKIGPGKVKVKLAGRAEVPTDATALVVSVRTSASKAGKLRAWAVGSAAPSGTHAFGKGNDALLVTLKPSAKGEVYLQAPSGKGTAKLQVVGWAQGSTTVNAVAKHATLATVKPDAVRKVAITGWAASLQRHRVPACR
ncbi:MAG: hypothetical protein HZY75_09200 [Nocardioidaceae bacterium]|nr:MAG: hypothetical protein HZY75_09200 [Nocardioidaceae bacterium]